MSQVEKSNVRILPSPMELFKKAMAENNLQLKIGTKVVTADDGSRTIIPTWEIVYRQEYLAKLEQEAVTKNEEAKAKKEAVAEEARIKDLEAKGLRDKPTKRAK